MENSDLLKRIYLEKETVDQLESQIWVNRHIERYALIRQFVYGKVLDFSCGVGYGSYILAKNPDVKLVVGVDVDAEAIKWAKKNFASDSRLFYRKTVEKIKGIFDVLVCLETIEHLPQPSVLFELVRRCSINEIVISFPHKKTTHYNLNHVWDILADDVLAIFEGFLCLHNIKLYDSTILHLIRRHTKLTPHKRLSRR